MRTTTVDRCEQLSAGALDAARDRDHPAHADFDAIGRPRRFGLIARGGIREDNGTPAGTMRMNVGALACRQPAKIQAPGCDRLRALGLGGGAVPLRATPPRLEPLRSAKTSVVDERRQRPMVQLLHRVAPNRPATLFLPGAGVTDGEQNVFAGREIDRTPAVGCQEPIGNQHGILLMPAHAARRPPRSIARENAVVLAGPRKKFG